MTGFITSETFPNSILLFPVCFKFYLESLEYWHLSHFIGSSSFGNIATRHRKGRFGPNTGPVGVGGVEVLPGEFKDEVVSGVMREGEETTTGTEVVEVGVVTTEAVVGVDKEEVTTGAAAFCTTLDA